MNNSNNHNGGSVLAGLILGAAAGVVAGLLLAPEKGSVTREKLKKKAQDFSEEFEGKAKEFSKKAEDFAKEVEHKIKDKLQENQEGFPPKEG